MLKSNFSCMYAMGKSHMQSEVPHVELGMARSFPPCLVPLTPNFMAHMGQIFPSVPTRHNHASYPPTPHHSPLNPTPHTIQIFPFPYPVDITCLMQ